MYMTFRMMHGDLARMPEAIELAVRARDHLNSEHGARFAVSVNVGGDPAALSLSSPWEDLADYERVRAAVLTDPKLQSIIRMTSGMVSGTQDTIGQVLKAPSGRGAYAVVNTAMMHMPAVADAVPFAIEVAAFVDTKLDGDVGVLAAVSGNRAGIMWLRYADSLAQAVADGQVLESDTEYLDFFKRSESLYVPGSLEQAFWQILP
jgi:hypothetical protein